MATFKYTATNAHKIITVRGFWLAADTVVVEAWGAAWGAACVRGVGARGGFRTLESSAQRQLSVDPQITLLVRVDSVRVSNHNTREQVGG